MVFFIVVCVFLLIAIPLVQNAIKNSGKTGRSSDSGDFSNDPNFYTSSASERYGEPLDPATSDSSDANPCNDSDSSSDSDPGSCDSGDSGGSDGGNSSD